ncbi:hypothetical protein KY284_008822 [Solanum tuberosum]|nr:hypothetical protein KY284_008822 [Solanum tuberosum]
MKNIDTDGSKPWMPFGSTCLPNECNLNYVRIRDRISALEDRKRALLQDMISPATGEKESVDPK